MKGVERSIATSAKKETSEQPINVSHQAEPEKKKEEPKLEENKG